MKHILLIIACFFSIALNGYAKTEEETIVVKGVVLDENKEPLVGVNIVVSNVPGLGTVTDIDGKYTIKMEPYNRLVFSFIGYKKKEVLVKEDKVVNVQMEIEENLMIDEVVITGTGAQKKLTVTGAVSTVKTETLKSIPAGNVSNAMAGNVAGVIARQKSGQPGNNDSEFWIRGISTFGAGASALVLVDGFERNLNQVNVEDIESFTVLKDASETAIYGSRGANGVVLITTKRGKDGKINIDGKLETMYNTPTILPDFVDGYTYASLMNEARITRNNSPIYATDELEALRRGLDPDILPNVNWMDEILKKGAMSERATLNINGGGRSVRYYISSSYVNEEGMYKTDKAISKEYNTNTNNQRWNYRMNADVDITRTTLLQVGIGGMYQKLNESGASTYDVWNSLMGQNPVAIPKMYSNGYFPSQGTGNRMNPWVQTTQCGFREKWWNQIQTNVSLTQDLKFITPGLKFIGRFGFDTYNYSDILHEKRPELWKAERFRSPEGDIIFRRIDTPKEMKISSYTSGEKREYLEAELQYQRNFNSHDIGGVLKYSCDSRVVAMNTDDIKNALPYRHQGLAGKITYNWKYKYFLNFNFGYTGSENFATGKQYGFFPAYSLAWNIAEEKFIKDYAKWMNMFKLRYSWGKVGSDNTNYIRFPYIYDIGKGNGYNWGDYYFNKYYDGLKYTKLASTSVTWEIATKHDIGIDMSLFNDKFTLTMDYFYETRDGIYMERQHLPNIIGLEQSPSANVGKVLSKGWDGNFAFNHKIGEVDLTVRGNMTLSNNKVLDKDEIMNVYPYRNEIGYRVNQAKGLIALGLFKDYDDIRNSPKQFGFYQPGDIKYKDVNGDGEINYLDEVAIGSTTIPSFIYGMGISTKWKNFDVNLHFQGTGKSSFFIGGPTVMPFRDGDWGNILTDFVNSDRWISADISGDPSTENINAKYPRLCFGPLENNLKNSTFWLRDGSYLRLKTLEVGYNIPKHIINKLRINDVRLFFIGTNLFTWSKFDLWDPELGSSDGVNYPIMKTFTLGINFKL